MDLFHWDLRKIPTNKYGVGRYKRNLFLEDNRPRIWAHFNQCTIENRYLEPKDGKNLNDYSRFTKENIKSKRRNPIFEKQKKTKSPLKVLKHTKDAAWTDF